MSWWDPTSWDVGDIVDAAITLGTSGMATPYVLGKKAANAMNQPPDTVNSRGDVLTEAMKGQLNALDPAKHADVLSNWLTAGGPPAPIDPGMVYAQEQAVGGVEAKAAAGRGLGGLFGFGKSIGDMGAASPRPFQAGVAYAAKPAPKLPSLNPILRPGGPGVVAPRRA